MDKLPNKNIIILIFGIALLAVGALLSGCQTTRVIENHTFTRNLPNSDYSTTHARSASNIVNGVLAMTIESGMKGASSDGYKNTERIMFGHRVGEYDWVTQSFKVRVGRDFKAEKRTQVAQIKPWPTKKSPVVSVYLDKGGRVKCTDSDFRPAIEFTKGFDINLADGKWHQVVMNYYRSQTNGFCQVIIDGIEIIKRTDFNSYHGTLNTNAEIGIYRDALPYSQTVFFDEWMVEKRNDRIPTFIDKTRAKRFQDSDWNTILEENCPSNQKDRTQTSRERENSFIRITLNSGDKGHCIGDKRASATGKTYGASNAVYNAPFLEREEVVLLSKISKNKKYKLVFNVRFYEWGGIADEEFFTLGRADVPGCWSRKSISLYFGRNIQRSPDEMGKIGYNTRISNDPRSTRSFEYETIPFYAAENLNKWHNVSVVFDTSENPSFSLSWNGEPQVNNKKFHFISTGDKCDVLQIKFGIKRPHFVKYGKTSIFDFDKIKLIEIE